MDYFAQHSNPQYGQLTHISKYSRFEDERGRREVWPETVKRYFDHLENHVRESYPHFVSNFLDQREILEEAVLHQEIMPSMRAFMTAGPALERDNTAGYNCAYAPIETPEDFDEMLYVLMCGTGFGFSVERKYVSQLPEIPDTFTCTDEVIEVGDSRWDWGLSLRRLLSLLWEGKIPSWDLSRIRPRGARLKTFGGRSSGPDPLREIFEFAVDTFVAARGRKLRPLECHDMACKIAQCVVAGGVRRSALISLSDIDDEEMRTCKDPENIEGNEQRYLANNSYVASDETTQEVFLREWEAMGASMSGERGIFNRDAAKRQAAKKGIRDTDHEFGTNPCSEIILRPRQFCNLTEVIIREDDTPATMRRKVIMATTLGTLQSTLTHFPYLRDEWRKNCEEERLLGVSLTGIMDNAVTSGVQGEEALLMRLKTMKNCATSQNRAVAQALGIPESRAVTCVKPSGTVSQLTDTASGIHPRYARYYLRTTREDKANPLSDFLIDKGFYYEENAWDPNGWVFYFPMQAANTTYTADEFKGIDQLRLWQIYQDYWCEHKPSMTCYYTDEDFHEVGEWVWQNFHQISGVSFLPYDGHVYDQAPYQPVSREEYLRWVEKTPKDIDWAELGKYESTDNTTGSQEFACVGGACELGS